MTTVEHLIKIISGSKRYSNIVRSLIKGEASNGEWCDFILGVANEESIRYDINGTGLNNIIGKLYMNDVNNTLKERFSGENMKKEVKVTKYKIAESDEKPSETTEPQATPSSVSKDAMRAVVHAIRAKDYEAATSSFNDYTTAKSQSIMSEDYGYGDNETKLYNLILKNRKYKDEVEDMKFNGADGEEFLRLVSDLSRSTGIRLNRGEVSSLAQTLMRTQQ